MRDAKLSVCVFCGARMGHDPAYQAAATELGQRLAQGGHRLVYGAGDVGLMGQVARAMMSAGGQAMGVIPHHLLRREMGKRDLTQFIVTEDMHERKKVMFMNSDVIVVLPGGAGSLDEFFEVLTWAQIGLHKKPIYLVNIQGYWTPLVQLLHHIVDQGFADATMLDLVQIVDSVAALEMGLGQMS